MFGPTSLPRTRPSQPSCTMYIGGRLKASCPFDINRSAGGIPNVLLHINTRKPLHHVGILMTLNIVLTHWQTPNMLDCCAVCRDGQRMFGGLDHLTKKLKQLGSIFRGCLQVPFPARIGVHRRSTTYLKVVCLSKYELLPVVIFVPDTSQTSYT